MKTIASIVAAAVLLSSATIPLTASARPLLFTFVEPSTSLSVTFGLDSNPTPTSAFQDSFTATVSGATLNGVSDPNMTSVGFATAVGQGGFAPNDGSVSALGAQLFSGGTSSNSIHGQQPSPVFSAGYFNLYDPTHASSGVLTISDVSAVPEPSTWALLIAGFSLAGLALRRRAGSAEPGVAA